jgi:ComF family protein
MLTIGNLRRRGGQVVDLLFPPQCVLCGCLDNAALVCERCAAILPVNRHACRRCAEPLGGDSLDADLLEKPICGRCLIDPPEYRRTISPMLYQFPVSTAIKSLKFGGGLWYLPLLASWLAVAVEPVRAEVEALVPVPLHYLKHGLRGFNQARELAFLLSRQTGLPLVNEARRIRSTASQSDLTADARADNMCGAFAVDSRLRYKRLLIVDDVMTTGETCAALTRALTEAGAQEVSVLTVARAPAPGGN